jgi:hypothetical protein
MPGSLETGSERENVLAAFHNHPDLTLPGEHVELKELLQHNPKYFNYELRKESLKTGLDFLTRDNDTSVNGVIEIRRSEEYLENQGILLEALIRYEEFEGSLFLHQKHGVIAKNYSIGYVKNVVGEDHEYVATLTVPMTFDGDTLRESVDAAVSILKHIMELQIEIGSTIINFRPEETS